MPLENVRAILVDRLEEGDRGDRGWFIITRVHVALSWLKGIAEYLESRGGNGPIELLGHDYDRIATIANIVTGDPGVQLRRHHLLVMDKPLQLLQRINVPYWNQIQLTDFGHSLANADDPANVLEQSLSAIQFAVEPWSPLGRVQQYDEFKVRAYEVTKNVLEHCGGYIDRNEFDFFVSRIREQDESDWAIDAIGAYRQLAPEEQVTLHTEISNRIPGDKAYSNWRDVGLHTFSLFSLGTSMVREDTRLLLTSNWVGEHSAPPPPAPPVQPGPPQVAAPPQLRMPEPPELEALLNPPAAPASNDGADAESFVAKVLRSQGWEVAFYINRRGYGFDLWARKENRAMVIEVKSSLGNLGAVNLTPTEFQAAQEHGDSYFLALVESMDSPSPRLWMIQNPAENLEIEAQASTLYVISRAKWLNATQD
jgi:hypothetical protein